MAFYFYSYHTIFEIFFIQYILPMLITVRHFKKFCIYYYLKKSRFRHSWFLALCFDSQLAFFLATTIMRVHTCTYHTPEDVIFTCGSMSYVLHVNSCIKLKILLQNRLAKNFVPVRIHVTRSTIEILQKIEIDTRNIFIFALDSI